MTRGREDVPLVCLSKDCSWWYIEQFLYLVVENTHLWESKQNLIMNEAQGISPTWPGPIMIVCGCLLLSMKTLGRQRQNKGFLSSKKYKIFGICTLTSSCNNVFYCLEKKEVNPCEAKVMKTFSDFYGYMWRYIWHFPFLKGGVFLSVLVFLNGSNGLSHFSFPRSLFLLPSAMCFLF